MKKALIILSSITTLTLASNASLNIVNNNNTIANNKFNSNPKDIQPSSLLVAFNNTFGYLNKDNWITNQSIVDHKYYSYDTNYAKTSDGKNIILSDRKKTYAKTSDGKNIILSDRKKTYAKNTFIVDNTGRLIIKSELNLSAADRNTLKNIQAQMINNKKVTTIKDSTNFYSNSEYKDDYFSCDKSKSDWKYLQMGGIEKHIDISSKQSAIKVDNNSSLSEAWGLYYIAKALRHPRGITEAVAKKLTQYFISQSSLKNLDINLIYKIIDVIATNDDVYNLFNDGPAVNKNNSSNYIFDKDNNLIEVYYNRWATNDINKDINYKYSCGYNGTNSMRNNSSVNINLLNWTKYARDWTSFIKMYPTLTFDNNSYIEVSSQYGKDNKTGKQLKINTTDIGKDQLWYIENKHDGGFFGAVVSLQAWVLIAHNDNNIFIRWHIIEDSARAKQNLYFKICLGNCSFISIMN